MFVWNHTFILWKYFGYLVTYSRFSSLINYSWIERRDISLCSRLNTFGVIFFIILHIFSRFKEFYLYKNHCLSLYSSYKCTNCSRFARNFILMRFRKRVKLLDTLKNFSDNILPFFSNTCNSLSSHKYFWFLIF